MKRQFPFSNLPMYCPKVVLNMTCGIRAEWTVNEVMLKVPSFWLLVASIEKEDSLCAFLQLPLPLDLHGPVCFHVRHFPAPTPYPKALEAPTPSILTQKNVLSKLTGYMPIRITGPSLLSFVLRCEHSNSWPEEKPKNRAAHKIENIKSIFFIDSSKGTIQESFRPAFANNVPFKSQSYFSLALACKWSDL